MTYSKKNTLGEAPTDFQLRLRGYRLTTAEITYRLPDYPAILQEFVWQKLDLAPKFPELRKFLDFWQHTLEGPLVAVTVASSELLKPQEFRLAEGEFRLN